MSPVDGGTLVFIPTYNERENVEKLLDEILGLDLKADVLFVDDGSPDGTGEILDRLAERHANVRVIHRPGKMGIGSAHAEGIRWAYDRGYSLLITMDCDFTHRPSDVAEFLRHSEENEVVVGSRYLDTGGLAGWSLTRRALTQLGHLLTRMLLGLPYDATGAFRVYRLDRIPRSVFELAASQSYSFFFESLYILHVNRYRIAEIPIVLPARTYGHSKMRFTDALQSLSMLVQMMLSARLSPGQYRLGRAEAQARTQDGEAAVQEWDEYWGRPRTLVSRLYGGLAGLYRRLMIRRNLNRLAGAHFPPGARVLHVGCGSGEVDVDLPGGLEVTALDISAPALRLYARNHGGGAAVVRGTIFDLPMTSDSMDGIYHLGLLEHFTEEEVGDILLELNRVLKPGGRMIVFWPPRFGLTVTVLGAAHFILNTVLRRSVRLHPEEITLVRSKGHAMRILESAKFDVEHYYFGARDMFTQCMIVAAKPAAAQVTVPAATEAG